MSYTSYLTTIRNQVRSAIEEHQIQFPDRETPSALVTELIRLNIALGDFTSSGGGGTVVSGGCCGPVEFTDNSGSTTGSSQLLFASKENRAGFIFQNLSDTTMYLNFGSPASASSGSIRILPGGNIEQDADEVTNQSIYLYCASSGKEYTAKEGEGMPINNPSLVEIFDEGVSEGSVSKLNFVGTGVDVNIASGIATIATTRNVSYETTFNNSNLTAGQFNIPHNLGYRPTSVVIWSNTEELIEPDDIIYIGVNSITIDISSFTPISGTWIVAVN